MPNTHWSNHAALIRDRVEIVFDLIRADRTFAEIYNALDLLELDIAALRAQVNRSEPIKETGK